MALSVVNSSSGINTNGSSITLGVPSGTQDGDLLLAQTSFDNNRSGNTPAGWNLLGTATGSLSTGWSITKFYWRLASSEPANYAFTLSSAGHWAAAMVAIRGHNGIGNFSFSTATGTLGASASSIALSASANSFIFTGVSFDSALTGTPGGLTLVQNVTVAATTRNGLDLRYEGPVSAGTTTPRTYNATSGGTSWALMAVEVLALASVSGTATGTAEVTGAATGAVAAQGIGAGSVGVTGATVGTVAVQGAAAGAVTVDGAAAAVVAVQGVATAAVGVSGVATGTVAVQGAASGAVGVSGAAHGSVAIIGTASATLTIAGAALGAVLIMGAGAGSVSVTGSATGTVVDTDADLIEDPFASWGYSKPPLTGQWAPPPMTFAYSKPLLTGTWRN